MSCSLVPASVVPSTRFALLRDMPSPSLPSPRWFSCAPTLSFPLPLRSSLPFCPAAFVPRFVGGYVSVACVSSSFLPRVSARFCVVSRFSCPLLLFSSLLLLSACVRVSGLSGSVDAVLILVILTCGLVLDTSRSFGGELVDGCSVSVDIALRTCSSVSVVYVCIIRWSSSDLF